MDKIKLGDKVKDRVSGVEGTVVARTKFLNGCEQCTIVIPIKKKGDTFNPEGHDLSIDTMNLELIKRNVVNSCEYEEEEEVIKSRKKSTGGANRAGFKMKGY